MTNHTENYIGGKVMANQKNVYINDPDVWEFINGLGDFSEWVREQARWEVRKLKRNGRGNK